MLSYNTANIPPALRAIPRWLVWHDVDGRKKPVGSMLDPKYRGPLKDARAKARATQGGIGFNFTGRVNRDTYPHFVLVCLDLDACRDPAEGGLTAWAERIVTGLDSWTEVSPSGAGLHVWLWAYDPNRSLLPLPRLPVANATGMIVNGKHKRAEVQVFGLGPAQYIAVTGKVENPADLRTVHVADLMRLLPDVPPASTDIQGQTLPTGDAPPTEQIRDTVAAAPDGEALLEGRWEECGTPSASEAWWRLVRHVLRAANNDGEAAIQFLLESTAWGEGAVDSFDPAKYARRDWVEADVIRVAARADEGSDLDVVSMFDDLSEGTPEGEAIQESLDAAERQRKAMLARLVLTGAEFMAKGFAPDWLVHDLLPRRGWAQIYGAPGTGKTPVALSLGCALAVAGKWFGFDVDNAGAVFYFVGEGETGIRARMEAQRRHTIAQTGTDPLSNFYFSSQPGALCAKGDVAQWVAAVKAKCPQGICAAIVDTQNANFGPGDENSTEDMTRFRHACEQLSRELNCLVITIHHSGLADAHRARGSTVQGGALETQIEVTLDQRSVGIEAVRTKDSESPPKFFGALQQIELMRDAKDRPVTAVYLEEGAPEAVLDMLDDTGADTPEHLQMEPEDEEMLRTFLGNIARAERDGGPQPNVEGLMGVRRGRATMRVETAGLERDFVRKFSRKGRPTVYELTAKGRALVDPASPEQVEEWADEMGL